MPQLRINVSGRASLYEWLSIYVYMCRTSWLCPPSSLCSSDNRVCCLMCLMHHVVTPTTTFSLYWQSNTGTLSNIVTIIGFSSVYVSGLDMSMSVSCVRDCVSTLVYVLRFRSLNISTRTGVHQWYRYNLVNFVALFSVQFLVNIIVTTGQRSF